MKTWSNKTQLTNEQVYGKENISLIFAMQYFIIFENWYYIQ